MGAKTLKDIKLEERKWEYEKEVLTRQQKIQEEKKQFKKTSKKITTTKLLILFLFINCTIIEFFTGWATVQSLKVAIMTGLPADFTPLTTLIGTVVGEVISFAIYAAKSAKENTQGGVVFENMKRQQEGAG